MRSVRFWAGVFATSAIALGSILAAQEAAAETAETRAKVPAAGVDPGDADSALSEAELAAEEAERQALRAREIADALRAEREAAQAAEADAGSQPVTRKELADAVERAERAADQAAAAARAVDEARQKAKRQTERTGLYLGGAFFYAAEQFDASIIVNSSTGGAGFVGYRLHSLFAAELRYEGFEGFDLKGRIGRAVIEGQAVTLIGRIFPIEGAIQPFASLGLGAIWLSQKTVFNDGSRLRGDETDAVFRFGGGIDFWLTDQVVLNTEAAYLAPFDELSQFESVLRTAGLTFRF